MGRILPFYRTGGVVSGGGGGNTGIPLGPFNDWSELPASAQDRAIAVVLDLGPTSSYGLAAYDAGAGQWQLSFGYFLTLADLNAFAYLKAADALASVGPLDDPTSVRYQWDDPNAGWLRTPDPVHYLYPQATDWADLPAEDTVQNMDEAKVGDLGYMHSSGIAERHGNAWELLQGKFQNVADMNDFDDTVADVRPNAIALVKSGGGHDEEAIAYSYQGSAWVRFGATTTQGYAWTLTETQLLTGADPSGIGAVQDGDYGTYTPAGGAPVVVRYKAACTVAVAAGGGTRAAWISPDAYAAATPTIQGYLLGSEDPTARGLQGWTDVLSAAGTRSITGNEGGSGETLLLAEFSGGSIASAQLACGVSAIVAGTKVWWGAVLRGDTTGTSESAVRFAGDGTNFNWLQQQNVGGTVRLTNSAGTTIDGSQIPGGTGTAWPGVSSTADVVFGSDTGSAAVSRVSRNGAAYTAGRRPAATSVQNNALRFATGAVVASSRGRLRVSYVIVVTY
jgi:hypothetical protein